MLKKMLNTFFGSRNDRLLNEYSKKITLINQLEPQVKKLKDGDFKTKTSEFKRRVKEGETLESLIVEVFAHAREASVRTLGMRHFDVQLMGGMALNDGKISEMRTGEGKTLVATLAVYLNSLSQDGVHVVTVNDYLAKRDAEWMSKLYNFLGLSVGVNLSRMDPKDKKDAYASDITYGTNNEFGFDYLRDNMVYSKEERVQRALSYAVVDEVDSILIDEARTPLVISGQSEDNIDLYSKIDKVVSNLKRQEKEDSKGDFWVDEKSSQVILSDIGHENTEIILVKLGILKKDSNLYDPNNINLIHHVNSALKAHYIFTKDKDYVVKDNLITIIDEFTGRMMPGRRWSDGLHQAIEAKEGVEIQKENQTLASITFQNYFRMYKKLSGMTGTADTEAEEFSQIYGLETIIIPPHRPTIRLDNGDKIYRTNSERYEAVIEDIRNRHTNSQPVLVGTTSIENSEFISKILNKEKLPHQVLNAKQHEKEAHIITQAGQPGVITIATNMAGRGTDIVLGGNIEPEIDKLDRVKQKKKIKDMEDSWKKRHQEVIDAGGLHIIGTERHESRRIDNQLRGRAGRQGDPGSSSFYLALDDSLLRLFGGDRVASIMDKLKLPEGEAIEHSMVTRSVESAQRKVEARNFDSRKQLLEFDDVPNNQRKVIYEQRNDIIDSEDIQQSVSQIRESVVVDTVYEYMPPESIEEMWDIKALEKRLKADYAIKINIKSWLKKEPNIPIEKIANKIKEEANKNYCLKEKKAGVDVLHHFERSVMLQIIDQNWRAHLSSLDQLRQGIGLRAYGQKDPKQEFKKEAFSLFEQLLEKIKFEIIRVLMLVQVKNEEQVNEMDKKNEAKLQTAKSDSAPKKVSRNDPCPCGSKKKYKHCHGKLI
jgi:preprotein translocase subunit SecA|tara:strand:+ start:1269 stop:3905 length:2637 start_codon:yes stop_codon:yes gene_type:complete